MRRRTICFSFALSCVAAGGHTGALAATASDDSGAQRASSIAPGPNDATTGVPNPFAALQLPADPPPLGPLRSVRPRVQPANEDAPKRVSIRVTTDPSQANVYFGGKLLGRTPLLLRGKSSDPPLDLAILHPGRMTLRTRIVFDAPRRSYQFDLAPGKLH